MNLANVHNRDKPWKIGSFTKNFRWGEYPDSLQQLHKAINIGFEGSLKPVARTEFRRRLSKRNLIDYIPANFFVFNQIIDGNSYVAVDELIYQALSFPHGRQFDRLATFTLLLSEVGRWQGADPEQAQPSDWARFFVIDHLSNLEQWRRKDYSADKIEKYLQERRNFEGNTRKLSTNLSYFFNAGDLGGFADDQQNEWLPNSIFLALDRYYLIERPQEVSLGWCIDALRRNDIVDLIGPETDVKVFALEATARLFSSSQGLERFVEREVNSRSHIIAILSRDPALFKKLPSICARWLSKRLFVELALDEQEFASILATNFDQQLKDAVARAHNTLPRPTMTGDDIIALFRGNDDNH